MFQRPALMLSAAPGLPAAAQTGHVTGLFDTGVSPAGTLPLRRSA